MAKNSELERGLLNETSFENRRHAADTDVTDTTAPIQPLRRVDCRRPYESPSYYGAAQPHTPTAEEEASLWSRFTYAWITPVIRVAADGKLPRGVVQPLTFKDKAHSRAVRFFSHYQATRKDAHTWDHFIDSASDTVRRHDDPDSRGVIRWVGALQQAEDPNQIVVGVEWRTPPAEYLKGGILFVDGTVDGEKLFDAPSGMATIELPTSIRFVHAQNSAIPKSPSVFRTLLRSTTDNWYWGIGPRIVYEACYLAQPTILKLFVLYVSDKGISQGWSYEHRWLWGAFIAFLFIATSVGQTLTFNKFFHLVMRAGINSRSALMAQIFHKALTISPKAAAAPDLNVGRVVNMMSSDVQRINETYGYIHYVFTAPFQLIVCVVLLYDMIGWVVFASIALTVFTAPLQGIIMKKQFKVRAALSAATDKRVKATNELFSAIRVIKYMGWERSFVDQALHYREIELAELKKIQYYRVASSLVVASVPMAITATVFILYHVTGHTLTPEIVFPVMALLNIMRSPFMIIPMMFNFLLQALVSIRRLNRYLNADDLVQMVEELNAEANDTDAVVFNHATFAAYQPQEIKERRPKVPSLLTEIRRFLGVPVSKKSETEPKSEAVLKPDSAAGPKKPDPKKPGGKKGVPGGDNTTFHRILTKTLLHDVTAAIPKGKFTVVVGSTGSGKTLFLESILGELTCLNGCVTALKSIAYVPQQPWIMNATVRENVIFFTDLDQPKFDRAAAACSLDRDLELLSDGALTEIGERGVNLSGGQRARVALARAVYADRDIYLLDDPLSAVDAHVSKDLVDKCITGILANKTRILVTHQHHVLPKADHIIALKHGAVEFQGTYHDYRKFAMEQRLATPHSATSREDSIVMVALPSTEEPGGQFPDVPVDGQEGTPEAEAATKADEDKPAEKKPTAMMSTEERAEGSVPRSTYIKYLRGCGGIPKFIGIMFLFGITELINAGVSVWIALWANQSFGLDQTTYLYIYVAFIVCGAFSSALRAFVIYQSARIASRSLHAELMESVSKATMTFFDTTPLGRILNRFSKDVDTLDNDLPMNYLGALNIAFSIVSSTTIMLASQFFVAVALIPAGIIYSRILVFYNAANREIKRVDSINKSPVFALLSEAIEGAKTIAAFGCQRNVLVEALNRIDAVFSTAYLTQVTNRWLGVRMDNLGNLIVCSLAVAGVICHMLKFGHGDVGIISLGLTMGMNVTSLMNWFVRSAASVEAEMNSIERILFYSNSIDHEDFSWYDASKKNPLPSIPLPDHLQHRGQEHKPPAIPTSPRSSAPASALGIEFRNVCLRYRPELPLVLKDLSFTIKPRQKVGIVGRTGSGKSTTLMAFLRVVDIASGTIEIQGQRHDSLALEHLRSLFAMIAQEPVLFNGTVRYNLDPFNDASDEEVREALRKTGMIDRVDHDGGIDADVSDGGKNFSVGQRQLLCMARALLKRSTGFILMDEATANIDPENDKLIQRTIRTAFADRTVITIAHRLATVIDSDVIIVMDAGEAREVGAPHELLRMEQGIFRSMIDALGPKEAKLLTARANKEVTSTFEDRVPE